MKGKELFGKFSVDTMHEHGRVCVEGDGKPLEYVVYADTETGSVVRFKRDPKGFVLTSTRDEVQRIDEHYSVVRVFEFYDSPVNNPR